MCADLGVESQQADAVPLMVREVTQGRGENSGVIDLLDLAGTVVHRSADIEQHENTRVRLTFKQLDIEAVRPRINIPVDSTDFVTGHVWTVGCEVDAESHVR